MNNTTNQEFLEMIERKISEEQITFKKKKSKLQACLDASATNFRMTSELSEYSRDVQNSSAALMVWHHLKDIVNKGIVEGWNVAHVGKLILQELVQELNPNLFGFNDDEIAALRKVVPQFLKEFTE